MNKLEQKEYIRKTWSTSSGKRIKEMLRRYWGIKEVPKTEQEIVDFFKIEAK